ncbi:LysR family transcriptional regulator [Shewanella sp. A14]
MDRLRAAEVFMTIVDQGSMAGAGRALDMSRSMITRYLSQMESWSEVQLLHRSTRKLSLTSAGEKVYLHCQQLLEIASAVATPIIDNGTEPHGIIRLACSGFTAEHLLFNFVQHFTLAHPKMTIDFHISNEATNLIEQRIDLAIRITNALDPNIIARNLGTCHSTLCASPNYIKRHGHPQKLADLTRHNCLVYSNFGKSLWHFMNGDQPSNVAVSGNISANESSLLLNAALYGHGISLQPSYAVAELIQQGQLVELLPDFKPLEMGIYAIYRSRKHQTLGLRTFIDKLVEHITTLQT